MKQELDARVMAKAFKALSNPNRLTIYLEILNRHEDQINGHDGCLIAEIMSEIKIGAPTVSHHVKELVNANLIDVERKGKFVNCHLNQNMREELRHFFTFEEQLAS